MELQQLKYFKTVAEIGKISAAAESLFISAPALSTSISRLEKELGMPLFQRTNNSITLNRQGQILLRYVNQVFANLDCARVELRESMLPQGHHVSVATMTSNSWIDLIAAFSQDCPHFTLACTSQRLSQFAVAGLPQQFGLLLAEDGDGMPDLSHLERMPLFEDRIVAMVHPDHPLRENLFFPTPDYPLHGRLMSRFATLGIPVPNGNANTMLVSRHMVAEGKGVAFSTAHTGRTMPEGLCYVPVSDMEVPWTVSLYWRKNRKLNEDECHFREFVKQLYVPNYGLHKV